MDNPVLHLQGGARNLHFSWPTVKYNLAAILIFSKNSDKYTPNMNSRAAGVRVKFSDKTTRGWSLQLAMSIGLGRSEPCNHVLCPTIHGEERSKPRLKEE